MKRRVDAQRPEEQPADRSGSPRTHAASHGRGGPRLPGHRAFGAIDSLILPDPDDRHVLAAAIHGEAGVIVTFNLADFPPGHLAPRGVEARHPDDFFLEILVTAADEFCDAVRLQRQGLRNPPKSVEEFLANLEGVGLPTIAAHLRDCTDRL